MSRPRAAAPQDSRAYVRLDVGLPLNPKLAELDDPAAGWLYVTSICYSAQSFTDGHFPVAVVTRLAGVDRGAAEKLVAQGLWHLAGHECDRCDQPKAGYAVVHDYLQHQRSAEEVRGLSAKRAEAGRRGAERRWGADGGAKPMASATASATATARQTVGREEKRRGEPRPRRVAEPPRADVLQLCTRLRSRIAANGVRLPEEISQQWLTDARLMLDKDGRDLGEALRVIDWSAQDKFWRRVVLSAGKLREKYDQLRLRASDDPRWRHLRAVEDILDDELDPDDILGPDPWRPDAPPREIDEGPEDVRREWYRQAQQDHQRTRLAEARAAIARQQSRGTA
ncbi:hypothetical protein ACQPW3_10670 [Actinosynnema sp. CA-248983]